MNTIIKLYGAERCHKTQHYKMFFDGLSLDFEFFDVEQNVDYAEELRNLYNNRKLNFPTITIDTKTLRNPSDKDLLKWLDKYEFKYKTYIH
ncbi:glutaredoxin family protein [Psychroserpens sp.]|uniref:glutaredoxin family protein n=1 Tax=Psychroserpens sp. TaxID=2020870 RepID=UPI003859353A